MKIKTILLILTGISISVYAVYIYRKNKINSFINASGNTLETRITVPQGFERSSEPTSSFAFWLRKLQLKPYGSKVMQYNGIEKWNQDIAVGVVDLPIGKKDLHQCADAVIRLRAEYLYATNQKEAISFKFTNGFICNYSKWIQGFRVQVKDNKCNWIASAAPGDNDEIFWKYLETVFTYAGTLSLEKELIAKQTDDIQPGDVWIKGGSPGHAVIVGDVITNKETGEKLFLLLQSYMPAQDIHIIANLSDISLSPWYKIPSDRLHTPEWTFYPGSLKTWKK